MVKKIRLKSNLSEIKKETTKRDQKSKKNALYNIEELTKQEMRLLNFMMIILQWH